MPQKPEAPQARSRCWSQIELLGWKVSDRKTPVMSGLTAALACLALAWVPCFVAGCNQNQYTLHENLCCDLCSPGYFVKEDCRWEAKTVCQPCPLGTYSELLDSRNNCKECTTCQQDVVSECTLTSDTNCSCTEGFLCTSTKCSSCHRKEECARGHQLVTSGWFVYSFQCEPCPDNTYSDTVGGTCKLLKRCEEFGLETIFPGNKTHESKCSDKLQSEVPGGDPDKASVDTMVLLVILLLLCMCPNLVVLVKACLRKVMHRKQKRQIGYIRGCPSITIDLPEKTLSFHLSKEEKGDGPIQEIHAKASLTSLTSLTEDIAGTSMTGK